MLAPNEAARDKPISASITSLLLSSSCPAPLTLFASCLARSITAECSGRAALFIACQEDYPEIARLLLEAGAAIDQAKNNGATPLSIACHQGHLEVAKLLSSYGASRAATPFGTPEEVATEEGHADLAAWLVASRGWTPLAHLETLTAARALSLLRSGASLHEGEPTPLQRAAGGEGEAAALVRRAAAPWSPASHSLFPVAALLVRSLYEIHESTPTSTASRRSISARACCVRRSRARRSRGDAGCTHAWVVAAMREDPPRGGCASTA